MECQQSSAELSFELRGRLCLVERSPSGPRLPVAVVSTLSRLASLLEKSERSIHHG